MFGRASLKKDKRIYKDSNTLDLSVIIIVVSIIGIMAAIGGETNSELYKESKLTGVTCMDKINEIWPKWHTVEPIGRGAFGEVYKIKREEFGETFYSAVKVIGIPNDKQEIQELIDEGQTVSSIRYYYESIVKNLMNEIKVLEKLKSAGNVVNIEEFEIQERQEEIGWDIYIRMELLKNLNEYRRSYQMKCEDVEKLGIDICKALEYCEQCKIIHRDIKPSNIFVDDYGNFKLGDFGIARQMERTQSMMSQKGTQKYMAPEVWFGNQEGSYNVDIYSLGLVMYQLLNRNRMPFEPVDNILLTFEDKEEALWRRLKGELISPPVDAPEGLGRIIVKACTADRKARYQSAHEMYTDLMEWRKEKKEGIEKVKKSASNKIKTEEKINDEKIGQVSEEKETEDTILLDEERTIAVFKKERMTEEEEKSDLEEKSQNDKKERSEKKKEDIQEIRKTEKKELKKWENRMKKVIMGIFTGCVLGIILGVVMSNCICMVNGITMETFGFDLVYIAGFMGVLIGGIIGSILDGYWI